MSVNINTGAGDTALFLAEKLILEGTPAREAFQSYYKSHRTFQARHPHDYHRLRQLAKCVKRVFKGCTIREAAKIAGWSESHFKRVYPQLADKCRDSERYREMSRLAAICEHIVADPEASLGQIANRIGETPNMVYKAHKLYYGY